MAIFNETALKVLRERMFISGMYVSQYAPTYENISQFSTYVTLHSGVQPTANDVKNNWSSYNWNNSNFLGAASVGLKETGTSSLILISLTTTTANRSGTATWATLWSIRKSTTASGTVTYTTGSFTSVTPPTNHFFVVPISDITTTTGVVKMNDTNLVAGQVSTISDITLKLGF